MAQLKKRARRGGAGIRRKPLVAGCGQPYLCPGAGRPSGRLHRALLAWSAWVSQTGCALGPGLSCGQPGAQNLASQEAHAVLPGLRACRRSQVSSCLSAPRVARLVVETAPHQGSLQPRLLGTASQACALGCSEAGMASPRLPLSYTHPAGRHRNMICLSGCQRLAVDFPPLHAPGSMSCLLPRKLACCQPGEPLSAESPVSSQHQEPSAECGSPRSRLRNLLAVWLHWAAASPRCHPTVCHAECSRQ